MAARRNLGAHIERDVVSWHRILLQARRRERRMTGQLDKLPIHLRKDIIN